MVTCGVVVKVMNEGSKVEQIITHTRYVYSDLVSNDMRNTLRDPQFEILCE